MIVGNPSSFFGRAWRMPVFLGLSFAMLAGAPVSIFAAPALGFSRDLRRSSAQASVARSSRSSPDAAISST